MLMIVLVELPLYYYALGVSAQDRLNILNMFIALMTLFLNPVYIVSGIAHVARSWDITVFEISMLGGWLKIAVARIVSILLYMAPYAALQSTIAYLFSLITPADSLLVAYIVLSIYLYAGLALLLSLVKSKTATLLTSAAVLFIAPISVNILASNYLMFGVKLGPAISIISYIFNPVSAYWYNIAYPGFIQLNRLHGLLVDTTTMASFYSVFILLFRRSEIKI